MNYRTFAWRFYAWNNWSLNACRTVLRRVQKVLERLHGGFASCTKRHWTFAWSFCIMNKRALNVCMEVLHVCKKVLKLVHGGGHVYKRALKLVQGTFARVQKGIEQCKNGLVHGTIWPWSYFKSFLRSVQFDLEVTSSHFCAVYNLGLKLLQGDSYDNHVEGVCPCVLRFSFIFGTCWMN